MKNEERKKLRTVIFLLFSLFFLLFSFLLSCATVPPVERARESQAAESIEAVSPRWTQISAPGLDYYSGKAARPRILFYALRVDLTEPGLRVTAAPGGTDNNGKTVSGRVSSFVRDNGLLAGINALPFDPSSDTEGEPRVNVGVVIAGGVTLSPPHKNYDALVFLDNGNAVITAQSEINGIDNIENAVGGFYRILERGMPAPRVLNLNDRHPRSAAGVSLDGKYLYLLVVDGRQINSIGCTEAETALLLKALGASEGINLDGGGSSAMALRYPDGSVRLANNPIHGNIPGRERAVAGYLGIGNREENYHGGEQR